MRRFVGLAAAAMVAVSACTGSPSGPSGSASAGMFRGQAVSAIDSGAESGVTVQIGSARSVTDQQGFFQADVGSAGPHSTSFTGNSIVERLTTVTSPDSDVARLSLIPSSFDLTAFDQMFRGTNSQLERWTTQPSLVVLASVMVYSASSDQQTATSDQMSDAEVSLLETHLTEGLSILTGGTYTSFASVVVERPSSGDRVLVARDGKIVVGRYQGITSMDGTIGLGTWAADPNGAVTAGLMFLDRNFDQNDDRRRLLRIHELGHALGYLHVTSRSSIMNPSIGPEPTDFDRQGATIAFQRTPGNQSPDTDPGAGSTSAFGGLSVGPSRWAPRIR